MDVGFAGAGRIAAAMARGWAAGDGGPEQMLFSDAGSGKAAELAREVGGTAVSSNAELAKRSDLLVLAVKRSALASVAAEAKGAAAVLSLLAATTLEEIAAAFPSAEAFRAMPNLAVEVRRGVVCFEAATEGSAMKRELRRSLALLGEVVSLDDPSFDAATAVMGCSPAYFALAAEAIVAAGSEAGLDPALASSLVAGTLAGTGELMRARAAADIRRSVASRGGSTEAGLRALDQAGTADAFKDAVRASLARMGER